MNFKINGAGGVCLFVWMLIAVFAINVTQPPEALGLDADPNEFSAARAIKVMRYLLGDETPHPIGSAANHKVRDRLVAHIEQLDLQASIQNTVGCSPKRSVCGQVENVLTSIPGKSNRGVLLMAHYDSVSGAPGAADDASGVVAALEIARVLRNESFEKTLMFVFTDGEEVGLLGAGAFFDEHPWADLVDVVINLEGSGSGGSVYLLRPGEHSNNLVALYKSLADYPMAESVFQEVFKFLPNDTDFSQAMKAGKPGLDFVFSAERNHYHTPLDNIDNLQAASVQHHGENVLPVVRALLSSNQNMEFEDDSVYASFGQAFWINWPLNLTWLVFAITVVGFGVVFIRVLPSVSIGKILIVTFSTALLVVALVLVCIGTMWFVDLLVGTRVLWPANPWPWLIVLYASAAATAISYARPLSMWFTYWELQLGIWYWWLLVSLGAVWFLPLASYIFLVPTAFSTVCLLVLTYLKNRDVIGYQRAVAFIISAVVAFPVLLSVHTGELSLGLSAIPLMAMFLAILGPTIIPVMQAKEKATGALGLSGLLVVVMLGGVLWAANSSLYSAFRPQHITYHYVQNLDTNAATISANSPNPLPERGAFTAFVLSEEPENPWTSIKRYLKTTAASNRAGPGSSTVYADGVLRVTLIPDFPNGVVGLAIPTSIDIASAKIAGKDVVPWGYISEVNLFLMFNPNHGEVVFEFTIKERPEEFGFVLAMSFGLPQSESELLRARGIEAVPVHFGDVSMFYRKIAL